MSKCKRCNIEILDETDKCPLCHHVLEMDEKNPQRNMYPDARVVTRKYRMLSNCILFTSIVVESVLIYLNAILDSNMWWSFVVGLILLYVNVILRLAVMGKSDYRFKILSLIFMAVVFLIVIDFLTGYRGWGVNFIFPSGIILMDVGILILMMCNRRNWQSYIMLQLLMILISTFSLILIGVGIIDNPYVAICGFALSVFIFLGTVIIGDQRAKTELKRRFHL